MPRKKKVTTPTESENSSTTAVAELPAEPVVTVKRRKNASVERGATSTEAGAVPKKPRRKKSAVDLAAEDAILLSVDSAPMAAAPATIALVIAESPASPPDAAVTHVEPPFVQAQPTAELALPNEAASERAAIQSEPSVTSVELVPATIEPNAAAVEPGAVSLGSESPPFDPAPNPTPHSDAHTPRSRPLPDLEPDRPRFRSWSIRTDQGYEKLIDQKRGLFVIKFSKKPSDEILDTLKDAGFQYASDFESLGKCWLRRNDYEGRLQVEKIEMLLRNRGEGHEAER